MFLRGGELFRVINKQGVVRGQPGNKYNAYLRYNSADAEVQSFEQNWNLLIYGTVLTETYSLVSIFILMSI